MPKRTLAVFLSLIGAALVPVTHAQDTRHPGSGEIRLASTPEARRAGASVNRTGKANRKAVAKKPSAAQATPLVPETRSTLEERIAASQPVREPDPGIAALPLVKLVPPVPLKGTLGPIEAAARHLEGLVEEARGEEKGAHLAFHEAAESGYGPAQKKLGQIYGKGNSVVTRDYAESLRWYQRAREQGEDVPQPYAARNATTVR
ncbi:MAG TPA: hypothetical protein VIS77_04870 [Burkholderiales bacterium]